MNKPTMFFSHSSRDREILVRLKELFVEKTGSAIEVFLSCDGQSIPLGRNWVHRIEEGLEAANVMVIFLTPSAMRSDWIFFESGFAYAKDIRVVPVGFLGVDLASLRPPLSLLQGFNITSEDGLNNLIALANEEFEHNHSPRFSASEYQQLLTHTSLPSGSLLGEHTPVIDEITMTLNAESELACAPPDALNRIAEILKKHEVQHRSDERSVVFHGVSVTAPKNQSVLRVAIDPVIAGVTFPLLEESLRSIRRKGVRGTTLTFEFLPAVDYLSDTHKVTGRLHGSQVTFGKANALQFQDLEFDIDSNFARRVASAVGATYERGSTYLEATVNCDSLPTAQFGELITLLFEREILYFEGNAYGIP